MLHLQDAARTLERCIAEHLIGVEDTAVFFTAFGASSLDFQLAIWLDDPSNVPSVLSARHVMIFSSFEKRTIVSPFPQSDLHLRSSDVPLDRAPLLSGAEPDAATPPALLHEVDSVQPAAPNPQ